MAKSKDQPVFEEPEFNEQEFVRDEKERAKSVIGVFIIGALIGLLSGYFDFIGMWYFSVLVLFVFLVFLKFILNAFRMEIPKKASHKLFLGGEFILTWLVFWILFLNPPVHVVAGPQISDLQANISGNWTAVSEPSSGVYNLPVSDHSLRMYVNYKFNITSVSLTQAPAGSPSSTSNVASTYSHNHVYFNLTGSVGNSIILTVHAQSTKASSEHQFTINFKATPTSVAQYSAPAPGSLIKAGVV